MGKNRFGNFFTSNINSIKKSQLKKNILSSNLVYAVNAIVILVSYPIYLHYLGTELFGLWATLSVVISFGEFGNLGISDALIKLTAEEYGKNDKNGIAEYFTYASIILFVTSVILILTLILLREEIIYFLNIDNTLHNLTFILIPIVGIISSSMFYVASLRGITMGAGRMDLANYIFLGNNVIKILLSIILLVFDYGIWSIVLSIIATNILSIVLYTIIIKRNLLLLLFTRVSVKDKKLKRLFGFSSNLVGMKLIDMLTLPFIKIIITRYLGLTELAYFEIAWKAAYNIRGFFEKGLLAIMPRVSELFARTDKDKTLIRDLHNKGIKYVLYLGIPFIVIVYFFTQDLFQLWLQNNYNDTIKTVFHILLIGWGFSLIIVPAYYVLMGMGKVYLCLWESVLKSGINIIGLIILINLGALTLYTLSFNITFAIIISHLFILYNYLKHYRLN